LLDRVPLLPRRVQIGPQDFVHDWLERRPAFDARGGRGLPGFGHADASAAVTVRRPTWYFDFKERLDNPARASRRIAAYRSTFDTGGIDTAFHPDQPMLSPRRMVSKFGNTDFIHPRSAVNTCEQAVSELTNKIGGC
jgi:hypothetical protein